MHRNVFSSSSRSSIHIHIRISIIHEHTVCNLIQPDVDIIISVCAGLLMVKSQGVEQFMFNHCLVVTA